VPYEKDDVRAKLASSGPTGPTATAFSGMEYAKFYETEPQEAGDGFSTWYARGQNFVLSYTDLAGEVSFERIAEPEEHVVLLPDTATRAVVTAGEETVDASGKRLMIVPPGDSTVTVTGTGRVVRLVRSTAADLVALAANSDSYETAHENIPAFERWPNPPEGFKIRSYDLNVPTLAGSNFRLFRCTTFMVNFIEPADGPRDLHKLSPHFHDDFEQCSLVLNGAYVHHVRWPWTTDRSVWRDDQHEFCGAPSVAVIPPPSVHTSEAVGTEINHLVDIFSPPRLDFSNMDGWVLNAADYPMPVPVAEPVAGAAAV